MAPVLLFGVARGGSYLLAKVLPFLITLPVHLSVSAVSARLSPSQLRRALANTRAVKVCSTTCAPPAHVRPGTDFAFATFALIGPAITGALMVADLLSIHFIQPRGLCERREVFGGEQPRAHLWGSEAYKRWQ